MSTRRTATRQAEFLATFKKLGDGRHQTWEVWQDFITITACAISNAVDKAENHWKKREDMYMERVMKYTKEERMLFPKLYNMLVNCIHENPDQDFLGSIYMELKLSSHWTGQFFTPYHICEVMGRGQIETAVEIVKKQGHMSVYDPSCGAGATLLGFANSLSEGFREHGLEQNWQNHVLFVGQDIDSVVALMCYIQLSLMGCAGYIKIGDTLQNPVRDGENDAGYWYTTMYFHEVWQLRRLFQTLDNKINRTVEKPDKNPDASPVPVPEPEPELEPEAEPPKNQPEPKKPELYLINEQGQLSLF